MVHFVGAGPGAFDLITVRGKNLIENADIIIYAGSLVNKDLLSYAKKDTKIYDSKDMSLPEVIDVMQKAHDEGLDLVRLHTGEPSIYGAVREQMDELDRRNIAYESCPGVTAAFGAAAAINMEYTLPGISQSLIITRMEGRTAVPQGESIEEFASHKASMAIYLSAGMISELSARLINGGYEEDTPAAIIYKATWPDEKRIVSTVGKMAEDAKAAGIKNLAVILVGDAVAQRGYEKSRLYSEEFSTIFREASAGRDQKNDHSFNLKGLVVNRYPEADIFVFTDRAEKLGDKIESILADMGNLETGIFRCHMDEVKKRLRFSFQNKRAVIFISAAGIAVRSIAEFVKDKLCDSPVIVISEDGRFVIPILSGHMGGANRLAEVIADRIGAFKAITTATDINGTFQIDNYAKSHQLHIADREIIKKVASTHFDDDKNLSDEEIDSLIRKMINDEALIPKKYYLGIGCRRGKSFEEIEKAVNGFLSENKIDISLISAVSSIDLKKDEMGIRQFADKSRLPFVIYSSEELLSLGDGFSSSEVVKEKIGIDNVCERAAVAAAVQFSESTSDKKNIIIEKTVYNGITLALAEGIWSGKEI